MMRERKRDEKKRRDVREREKEITSELVVTTSSNLRGNDLCATNTEGRGGWERRKGENSMGDEEG